MPFEIDTDLIENDDVKITTNQSGEFVLEHKPTGNTLNIQGDGTLDVPAVSTEEKRIKGTLWDLVVKEEDSINTTSSSGQLSVSGNYDAYLLEYRINVAGVSGDFAVTFNGTDAVGNQSYSFWDESGDKNPGVDAIPIISWDNDFGRGFGRLLIEDGYDTAVDTEREIGLNNEMASARADRVSGYADFGSFDSTEELSTITLSIPGNGTIQAEIFSLAE